MVTDSVTANYLIEDGLQPNRCVIQPAFVDFMFFEKGIVNNKVRNHELTLGYIGRLVNIKRVDLLIEAVAYLREWGVDATAIIVGDGDLKDDLMAYCEKLNVEKYVSFAGWVSNVGDYITFFDIFVLPSRSEGSPISLLEAMAARKPCVVTNLRSLRDLVGTENVMYFRSGDSKHLAEVIHSIYNKPLILDTLGSKAREVAEDFTITKVLDRIVDTYVKVIKRTSYR